VVRSNRTTTDPGSPRRVCLCLELGAQVGQRQQPEPEEGVVEAADVTAAGGPLLAERLELELPEPGGQPGRRPVVALGVDEVRPVGSLVPAR
jgi:hypothetical protein